MATERLSETLIEIDGKVRVERGPARKTAVACPELLCNSCTHPDYQHNEHLVGKMVTNPETGLLEPTNEAKADLSLPRDESGGIKVYRDSLGKPIFHGDGMTYLDWLGEFTWYVYQSVELPEPEKDGTTHRWERVADYPTEAEAIVAGTKLAHGVTE